MSCHTLSPEKIQKTIKEKKQYLLPMLEKRDMHDEAHILSSALSLADIALIKKKTDIQTIDTLFTYLPHNQSDSLRTFLTDT